MSQPAAGVGVRQPDATPSSSPATRARVTAESAARSAASAAMSTGIASASGFGCAGLDHGQDLAAGDLLPGLGPEFGHDAGGGGGHGLLHLHRLQHEQRLTRG